MAEIKDASPWDTTKQDAPSNRIRGTGFVSGIPLERKSRKQKKSHTQKKSHIEKIEGVGWGGGSGGWGLGRFETTCKKHVSSLGNSDSCGRFFWSGFCFSGAAKEFLCLGCSGMQ